MGDAGHESREDSRGFGWALVAAQLALIAAVILAPGDPAIGAGPTVRILGGVAVCGGLAFSLWGAVTLGRALTPHPAPRPGAALVRHGPFALVSHPIYLGLGGAGLGAALLRDSWPAALFALTLCALLWAKAGYETRLLRRVHPDGRSGHVQRGGDSGESSSQGQ